MAPSQWTHPLTRRTLIQSAGLLAGGWLVGQTFAPGTVRAQTEAPQDGARPLLMAHYMPWYLSRAMGGITLNRAAIEAYLTQFYRKAARNGYVVGGAFPGFHDIYAEAGVQASYGYLDAEDGETFRTTLQLALDQNPDVIQLITWNDYGEGTSIEPAEEYGYRYLETVQETRRALPGEDFPYTTGDLRLPFQIYTLRKDRYGDKAVNADLDAAAGALLAGDAPGAATILDGLGA